MNVEYLETDALSPAQLTEVLALCTAAYAEPMAQCLADIGPGLHALGRIDGALVAHALIVTRHLEVGGHGALRTAYVELVATDPGMQRRGHASALMRALESRMQDFDLGALSPSDPVFYARLGWELWRGPLAVRTPGGLERAPADEQLMIRRLPRTPGSLPPDAPLSVEWRPGEVW